MSTFDSMAPWLILTSQGNCQFKHFSIIQLLSSIHESTVHIHIRMYTCSSGLSLKKRYICMYLYIAESLSSATGIFTRTYTNDSSVTFHSSMCEPHVKADEFECPTAEILL